MKIPVSPSEWNGIVEDKDYARRVYKLFMSLRLSPDEVSVLEEMIYSSDDRLILSLSEDDTSTKTIQQNRLYWALLREIRSFLKSKGVDMSERVFDEVFRRTFFEHTIIVMGQEIRHTQFSVSSASKKQMASLIDKLITQVSKNPLDGEQFAFGLDLTEHPALKDFNSNYVSNK